MLVGLASLQEPEQSSVTLAASAAHTRGKNQVISETYGASGWDLSPEEMRRLADWQSVRGVTRLVPHAFEFWQDRPFRLHERRHFVPDPAVPGNWTSTLLYP